MIITLLILNIMITLISMYIFCFSKEGIKVNHIFLFGVGFLFYWIFPIIVGEYGFFQNGALMYMWHGIYDSILGPSILTYLWFSACFSISFYFGHFVGGIVFQKAKIKNNAYVFDPKLLIIIVCALCPLIIFYIFQFRSNFFAFYQNDINISAEKGQFISLSLILLSLTLLYSFSKEENGKTFIKVVYHPITWVYFIVALLILTMGGRLYIFSSILMFVVYYSIHFKPIKIKSILIFFVGSMLIMGLIGVYRVGIDQFTFENIIFSVVAESLYTAFSLISYLVSGRIEMTNTPIFLKSDFLNLVPGFIMPNKAEMIVSPELYGYSYITPLGAMNSFLSFSFNFGMLGSVVVIFMFSFVLTFMMKKINNKLFKLAYIMIAGWIPFAFFRDPFSVSIVKQMFQFSFFVPALIIGAVILLTSATYFNKFIGNRHKVQLMHIEEK